MAYSTDQEKFWAGEFGNDYSTRNQSEELLNAKICMWKRILESAEAVRRSIVMQTMALAGIGVLVGAVVAAMGGRLASSLLFGVEPTDPVTFAATIVVLLVVCVISGLIPAIRASRVDSAGALRSAT